MPTLRELVSAYLAQKEREALAGCYEPRSLRRARWYLSSFLQWLGPRADLPITSARKSDLVAWVLANAQWQSSHTRTDALGTVVSCFRWCEAEPLIPAGSNPYRRAAPWSAPEPRAAITEGEYRALMDCLKRASWKRGRMAFRRALWFLWQTGCRTCEMRQARWPGVDWQAGLVILHNHKSRKATGRQRLIPLCPQVIRYLRWIRPVGPSPQEIFLNSRGRPWTKDTFARRFREYARLAGVREEVSAYSLRHGFASEGLRRGVSDTALAQVMGHASTRYVRWYGRSVEAEAAYLRRVAALVRGRRR